MSTVAHKRGLSLSGSLSQISIDHRKTFQLEQRLRTVVYGGGCGEGRQIPDGRGGRAALLGRIRTNSA